MARSFIAIVLLVAKEHELGIVEKMLRQPAMGQSSDPKVKP